MSCKKCGGNRGSSNVVYPVFGVKSESFGDDLVQIGAKSSILLDGLSSEQVFLRVGTVIKINNTAAIDLKNQGAPIWIL